MKNAELQSAIKAAGEAALRLHAENERLRGKAAEALARASDAERERLDTLMENDRLREALRLRLIDQEEREKAQREREERLRGALQSIAANTCCDRCQEAALVAQAALGVTTVQPQAAHSYASTCQHGNLPGACVLCAVAADKSGAARICRKCEKPVKDGRGGCEGAQHGNTGCAMNNPYDTWLTRPA